MAWHGCNGCMTGLYPIILFLMTVSIFGSSRFNSFCTLYSIPIFKLPCIYVLRCRRWMTDGSVDYMWLFSLHFFSSDFWAETADPVPHLQLELHSGYLSYSSLLLLGVHPMTSATSCDEDEDEAIQVLFFFF